MATTSDFRNGFTFQENGEIYSIIEFLHVKPGKGGAFVRTKLRNIKTKAVIERTFRATEKVEEVRLERRPYEFLYRDGDFYVFDHWDSVGKAPEEPSQRVTTIVMDANSILTAVYVQSTSFTLTVNGPPGVGTTPSVGANLYAQGTTVNISAPEFYSYNGDYRKFSHW